MKRALFVALVALVVIVPGVEAYLKLGARAGTRLVALRWDRPIRYAITNRAAPGVSPADLQAAVDRAFRTWAGVANVELDIGFLGFTNAEPLVDDGLSVIGFRPDPESERTLGAATHEVNDDTGQLIASDIFFNLIDDFAWSVAPNGQTGRFDVESIALHEIGHFLGLGHSMLGETEVGTGGRRVLGKRAVMFPIAYAPGNIEDRTLEADDVAGLVDSYGTSAANRQTGAVHGRVTLDGRGVFGAHLSVFNAATRELVGGFSFLNGEFVVAGLTPGLYVVRAEPLDDADLDSVFGDDAGVELDFRVTYHTQLVAVPAGGTSGEIEIKVRSK